MKILQIQFELIITYNILMPIYKMTTNGESLCESKMWENHANKQGNIIALPSKFDCYHYCFYSLSTEQISKMDVFQSNLFSKTSEYI